MPDHMGKIPVLEKQQKQEGVEGISLSLYWGKDKAGLHKQLRIGWCEKLHRALGHRDCPQLSGTWFLDSSRAVEILAWCVRADKGVGSEYGF